MRSELENTGRMHMQLAQRLSEDVLKSVKEFRNQQKDVRKKGEDTVRRAQNHKKSCFDRNNRLHTTYENKCRDVDKAQETLHKLETNPLSKPNQLQQAHKRLEAARAASNNADLQYQEVVKTLEEARLLWEREMEMLCHKFQELEEQRIAFLRHQMWTVCNLYSQSCVDEDEAYESVRKSLENCDVDADIDEFIKDKATGSERPAPVPYENYYNPRNKASLPGVPNIPTTPQPPHKELPPLPMEDPIPMDQGPDSTYSVPDHPSRMAPEAHYSVPRGTERVIALYDYDAQGTQELTLHEGDIVTVIGKEDDVWWCGQVGERIGMFPAAYVEPYSF